MAEPAVVVQLKSSMGSACSSIVGKLGMEKKKVWLKVVNDGGKWTGNFACSICNDPFRPDKSDIGKLQREFAAHVAKEHRDAVLDEDANRAVARIMREAATENR